KVSHVDAHEIRERLLADGHTAAGAGEEADVAVISSCCVTNEALSKSRKAAARAARTHRRVYVTGCGANLAGGGLAGLPENVTVVGRRPEETPAFDAGARPAAPLVDRDQPRERGARRRTVGDADGRTPSARPAAVG